MSLGSSIPDVLGPLPLARGGTWSAELESIDQRLDDVYYWVTRQDAGGQVSQFFVKTATISGSRANEALVESVQAVVERGTSNTDYEGSFLWRRRRSAVHAVDPHPILTAADEPTVLDLTEAEASLRVENPWWIGRYDEDRRNLYATELFTAETRTVHMGIDLGGPVGTPVHACLDGWIHAAGYNPAPGDYGCTLVLRHVWEGREVWMLLGHLSWASIRDRMVGQSVNRGEIVGWLGAHSENGGWPPHVHVQLAREAPSTFDLPGAVHAADREAARCAYPDPRTVLGPLY